MSPLFLFAGSTAMLAVLVACSGAQHHCIDPSAKPTLDGEFKKNSLLPFELSPFPENQISTWRFTNLSPMEVCAFPTLHSSLVFEVGNDNVPERWALHSYHARSWKTIVGIDSPVRPGDTVVLHSGYDVLPPGRYQYRLFLHECPPPGTEIDIGSIKDEDLFAGWTVEMTFTIAESTDNYLGTVRELLESKDFEECDAHDLFVITYLRMMSGAADLKKLLSLQIDSFPLALEIIAANTRYEGYEELLDTVVSGEYGEMFALAAAVAILSTGCRFDCRDGVCDDELCTKAVSHLSVPDNERRAQELASEDLWDRVEYGRKGSDSYLSPAMVEDDGGYFFSRHAYSPTLAAACMPVWNRVHDLLFPFQQISYGPLSVHYSSRSKIRNGFLDVMRAYRVDNVRRMTDIAAYLRQDGSTPESIARTLHADRRLLKRSSGGLLSKETNRRFEQRNIERYGNPLGPSVEQLRQAGKSWEQIVDSVTHIGGRTEDSIMERFPLDAFGLRDMASGHRCLDFSERVSWEEFPKYAVELLALLQGSRVPVADGPGSGVSVADGPDMRIWQVLVDGTELRLVYDDYPQMVSLESDSEAGDRVLETLWAKLSEAKKE